MLILFLYLIQQRLLDLYGLVSFLRIAPINQTFWWDRLVRDRFYLKEAPFLFELFGSMMWRTGKSDVLEQVRLLRQTTSTFFLNVDITRN